MTNREKFKEVFGYPLREDEEPCLAMIAETDFCCNSGRCCDCDMVTFWDAEYKENTDGTVQ